MTEALVSTFTHAPVLQTSSIEVGLGKNTVGLDLASNAFEYAAV